MYVRGPVTIGFFSLLIFKLSVTEIQLCKVNVHFLLDSCHYCMQSAFHSPNPQYVSITYLFCPFSTHSPPKTKLAVRNNLASPRQRVYTGELKEEDLLLCQDNCTKLMNLNGLSRCVASKDICYAPTSSSSHVIKLPICY